MSVIKIIAEGIKRGFKADVDVWLDTKVGDFFEKEIAPGTLLVIAENVKSADRICVEGNLALSHYEINFRLASDKDLLGLTDVDSRNIDQCLNAENYQEKPFKDSASEHEQSDSCSSSNEITKASIQKSKSSQEHDTFPAKDSLTKVERMELNELKQYENEILYKMNFIKKLLNPGIVGEHKSPFEFPTLLGQLNLIKNAEYQVLKYLRKIVPLQLNQLSDLTDSSVKLTILNMMLSALEEKFKSDPVAFNSHEGVITAYSIDCRKLEEITQYIECNLHKELVPINDIQKFEYFKANLSKNPRTFLELEEGVGIFPIDASPTSGFMLVAFGDMQLFEVSKVKLKRAIEQAENVTVVLNVTPQKMNEVIAMTESRYNVMLTNTDDDDHPTCAIINGVVISLVCGNIEEQIVDVLVNSTSPNMNLNTGEISKAISLKAGPDLQKECSSKGSLSFERVIETGGYNLTCKSVFHCLAKEWDGSNPKNSQDILMKIVSICLEMANKNGFTSIAFPPIACGFHKMPPSCSAESIFNAIEKYPWTIHHSLKDLRLVVCVSKKVILHAFQQVLDERVNKPYSPWQLGMKISIMGSCKNDVEEAHSSLLKPSLNS